MKKLLTLTLALALCFALAAPTFAADKVVPSPQALVFDSLSVEDFCAYNINGSNYFKLRDIAFLMSGTESEFAVGWDAEASTVSITTGGKYVYEGNELQKSEDMSATAVPSKQTILIDGKKCDNLSVYNIGGNNYFKLRDLGEALGFSVDYDPTWNTTVITSPSSALYMVKETVKTDEGTVTTTYTRDKAGRLTGYSTDDGSMTGTCTYSDHGVLLSETSSGISDDGERWTSERIYNGRGSLLSDVYTSGNSQQSTYLTYNDRGTKTGEKSEYSDGNGRFSCSESKFDSLGNLVSCSERNVWEDEEESHTVTYTNDAQGRPVRAVKEGSKSLDYFEYFDGTETYYGEGPCQYTAETVYVYEADRTTETTRTNYCYFNGFESVSEDGSVSVFDANGNLLSQTFSFKQDGSTSDSITLYTYNKNGQTLTCKSYWDNASEPETSEVFTYTEDGLMLSDRTDYSDGSYYEIAYTYDAAGHCVTESYENCYNDYDWETDSYTPVVDKTVYTNHYNAAGELIGYSTDSSAGHSESAFDLDEYGNTTRITVTVNGAVTSVTEYTFAPLG